MYGVGSKSPAVHRQWAGKLVKGLAWRLQQVTGKDLRTLTRSQQVPKAGAVNREVLRRRPLCHREQLDVV